MSTREEFTKRFPRYAECIENPQGHRRGKDLADAALAGFESGYQAATSRQEARIEALRDSLNWALSSIIEEPYEWSSEEDAAAHNAAIDAMKGAT